MQTAQVKEYLTSFKDVGTFCLKEWLQNYLFPFVHKEEGQFLKQAEEIRKANSDNKELHFILAAKIEFLTYRYINLDTMRQQGSNNDHGEIETLVKSIKEMLNTTFSDELYRLMYLLLIIEIQQEEEFSDSSKDYRNELLNSALGYINEDNADIFISLIDHYLQTEPNKQLALCLVDASINAFKGNEEILIEFSLKKADVISNFRLDQDAKNDEWTEWWKTCSFDSKEKTYDEYLLNNDDITKDYVLYARLKTSKLKYYLSKNKNKLASDFIENICLKLELKLKNKVLNQELNNTVYFNYLNNLISTIFYKFQSNGLGKKEYFNSLVESLDYALSNNQLSEKLKIMLNNNKISLNNSDIYKIKNTDGENNEILNNKILFLNQSFEEVIANHFNCNLFMGIMNKLNSYRMMRKRFFHKKNELYLYLVNNISYIAINFNKQREIGYSIALANNIQVLNELEEYNVRESLFRSIEDMKTQISKMSNKHIFCNLYFSFLLESRKIELAKEYFNILEEITKEEINSIKGFKNNLIGSNIQETIKNIFIDEKIINGKFFDKYEDIENAITENLNNFKNSKRDIAVRVLSRNFRSDIRLKYLTLYLEYEKNKEKKVKEKMIVILREGVNLSKTYLYIFNQIVNEDTFVSAHINFLTSLTSELYRLVNCKDELLNNYEYIYSTIKATKVDKSEVEPYTKIRSLVKVYDIFNVFKSLDKTFPDNNYNKGKELDKIMTELDDFPNESYAKFKWKKYYLIALEIYNSEDEGKLGKSKEIIEKAIKILDERFEYLSPEEKVNFFKENDVLSIDISGKTSYISAYNLYLIILYEQLEKSNIYEKSEINKTIFNILEKINTNTFRHLKTDIKLDPELSKLYKDIRILKLFLETENNNDSELWGDLKDLKTKLKIEEGKLGIIHKKIINTEIVEFSKLESFFTEQLNNNLDIPSFQIIYSAKLSIDKGLENTDDSLLIWSAIFSIDKNHKLVTEFKTTLIENKNKKDNYKNFIKNNNAFVTNEESIFKLIKNIELDTKIKQKHINSLVNTLKSDLSNMYNQIKISGFKLNNTSNVIVGSVNISDKKDIFIPWEVLIKKDKDLKLKDKYLFEDYTFDHYVNMTQYIESLEQKNVTRNKMFFLYDPSLTSGKKDLNLGVRVIEKKEGTLLYQIHEVDVKNLLNPSSSDFDKLTELLLESNHLSIHIKGQKHNSQEQINLSEIKIMINNKEIIDFSKILKRINNDKTGSKTFSFVNACTSKNLSYLMLLGNIHCMITCWNEIDNMVAKEIATYFYQEIDSERTVSEILKRAKVDLLNKGSITFRGVSIPTNNPIYFSHISLCGLRKANQLLESDLIDFVKDTIEKLEGSGK